MSHSFSQTLSLTCPQCGRAFSAELWLIVDTDERPELRRPLSSLLKSYRGQKPKVLKNRTSRVPSRLTLSALTGCYEPLTPLDPPSPLALRPGERGD